MPKKYWIIGIFSLLLCVGLVILGIRSAPKEESYSEQLKRIEIKLDSLYNKKDSVRTVIITIDKEINKNTKEYEKVVNSIIIQPSTTDSIFARDYIKKFINERVR